MLIGSDDRREAAPRGPVADGSEVLIGSARGAAASGTPGPSRVAEGPATSRAAGEPGGGEPDRRGWWARWGLLAGAAIVIIGLAIALILALLHISDQNTVSKARSQALAAARTYSLEVGSYNYNNLSHDFGLVEQHSTASFRTTWTQSSQALESVLTKYHATSVAHVLAAGVESASASKVVAIVFINQTVTNDTQKTPSTDQSRLEITLVHQHDQWLIDKLTLL